MVVTAKIVDGTMLQNNRNYPTLLRRDSKEKRRKRTERRKLCHITYQSRVRSGHMLPFSHSNYWLNRLTLEAGFRSEKQKSISAIFFCILLHPHDVLFDRRLKKSQTATGAMTLVVYDRGPL